MTRADGEPGSGQRLRVLSYNIEAGAGTAAYREYVTRSWRYLLPHSRRQQALDRIARLASAYDIIGLQETDAGSLRTAFLNQTEYVAHHAGLPHWYDQVNRRLGAVAQHSNGLISRIRAHEVDGHRLPGAPGRGLLTARFASADEPLLVLVAHLALGRRARARQLDFIGETVAAIRHVILMGDLNCDPGSPELRALIDATGLGPDLRGPSTFPSWRPRRRLDHILVSPEIRVVRSYVHPASHSDHLPVAMELVLPPSLRLTG